MYAFYVFFDYLSTFQLSGFNKAKKIMQLTLHYFDLLFHRLFNYYTPDFVRLDYVTKYSLYFRFGFKQNIKGLF